MTFKEKIKNIVTSIRFWIVTLGAITAILSSLESGEGLAHIFDIITVYFGVVAGIGTADSIAKKIGEDK